MTESMEYLLIIEVPKTKLLKIEMQCNYLFVFGVVYEYLNFERIERIYWSN